LPVVKADYAWSCKPNKGNSLPTYKGQVVGFCPIGDCNNFAPIYLAQVSILEY